MARVPESGTIVAALGRLRHAAPSSSAFCSASPLITLPLDFEAGHTLIAGLAGARHSRRVVAFATAWSQYGGCEYLARGARDFGWYRCHRPGGGVTVGGGPGAI